MAWTARDYAILRDIQAAGEMNREAILTKHFANSPRYMSTRMQRLKVDGLLQSQVRKGEDGNRSTYYTLTAKGASLACGEWLKPEKRSEPVHKGKRRRERVWTERDIRLLQELLLIREMTKAQVLSHSFSGKEKYGEWRLHVMKKEELLTSEVRWVEDRNALEATYRITQRGIRLLVERRILDEEGELRARDFQLTEKQREYILDANEIHFTVPNVKYLDSRGIKKKHEMNRGNLVAGGFEDSRGSFLIYIIQNDVLDKTVLRITDEIQELTDGVAGHLVYTKGFEAKAAFERAFVQQKVITGGIPVHVLPFNERGFKITRRLIFGGELPKLLEPYGVLVPTQGRYGFLYGMKCRDGTRKYVLEFLTGDRIVIDRSLKEYKGVLQNGESQGVLLFCWEEDVEAMQERVKLIPYSVEVIGLSFKTAFESSLPNP